MLPSPPQQEPIERPLSLSRVFAFFAVVAILVFVLVWAKAILVPIVFAAVFTLTLRPLCNYIERFVPNRPLAIVLTFLTAALPVAGAVLAFSYQTISVIDDLPTITEEFEESLNRVVLRVSDIADVDIETSGYDWARQQLAYALDEPFVYLGNFVAGAGNVVGTLLLIFLYTFLLLLYRTPIHHFILGQFGVGARQRMEQVMQDTQHMSYTYLKGLGLVMLILGVLNSLGLIIIGIEYALFWGFLAAFLAIIPYVGTFIGGMLPFLYALSTTDTLWQPIAVVGLFSLIQTIEGNIITPKVVGSSIQINPLAAILALFVGGFLWGVEGLILALPITAMLRIFFVHSSRFRPFGLLLSDDLQLRESEFLTLLDQPHYRLINLFRSPSVIHVDQAELSSTEFVVSKRKEQHPPTVEPSVPNVPMHDEA